MKRAPHFHTVTLEISLKPFRRTDEASVREVCAGVFEQWRPLLKARETISILIFAADGSEILDYSGDLDAPFEWCKYLGTANCPSQGQDDPPWRSLHERQLERPGWRVKTTFGQSYRLNSEPTILPDGTGLSDRLSDFVGRTELRLRDFVRFTHRFRRASTPASPAPAAAGHDAPPAESAPAISAASSAASVPPAEHSGT